MPGRRLVPCELRKPRNANRAGYLAGSTHGRVQAVLVRSLARRPFLDLRIAIRCLAEQDFPKFPEFASNSSRMVRRRFWVRPLSVTAGTDRQGKSGP